ncbi:lamin tail domain-containing protein [Lewinella sp. 4G2]|uniref:lamin tail domain-containing protein n=1 Tax=Lewinella sp. 4G2 TaxID=1803372 RepID=UPI0007B4E49A|nr:lamin tail domain-containing protein [Lewinella sp. 4G2]OAV44743.1 hypothetical protein A3850_009680 [Lewinella sp. 4G2]
MKLNFLLLACCLMLTALFPSLTAQTTVDDFEDGDLLNPEWTGDVADFVVEDGQLLLRADGAGRSVLTLALPGSSPGATLETFSLEFLVEMDFAPSGSNFTEIALRSFREGEALNSSIETKLGGISGDQDTWTGFGVSGGDVITGDFSGAPGALGGNPAIARIRITYNESDGWQLAADYTGGTDYSVEGTLPTGLNFPPIVFELACSYTATRSDKFSFDDFSSSVTYREFVDETAPRLISRTLVDRRTVIFAFDEPLSTDAATPSNFTFGPPSLPVASAVLSGNQITVTLAEDLPENVEVPITISGIADVAGNVADDISSSVLFRLINPPSSSNLLITEFLADPNPVVGLPEFEYVEVHNPSDTAVNLDGLRIGSGGTPVELQGFIPVGGYVVIADNEARPGLEDLGATVVLANLPGLSNSSDNIALILNGDTLQSIDYTDDWYNDADRDDGGYSIEYTSFSGADAGCSGRWRASLDPSGGTPGRENSVLNLPADVTGPTLTSTAITEEAILLGFDEPLGTTTPDFVLTREGQEIPITGIENTDNGRTFRLTFMNDLDAGILYQLSLPDVTDCVGNQTEGRDLDIGIPATPAPGDVVINEILYAPASGGAEFIELYNCSDKILQVSGWTLVNDQSTSSTASRDVDASRLFTPGQFLVFTDDAADLINRYRNVDPAAIIEQATPSLGNSEGNISVIAGSLTLDAFDYSDDLQSELIDDDRGVSLERLRYKVATDAPGNWFSAASAEGGATPTRANSQFRDIDFGNGEGDGVFSLLSKTFSPDSDGNEDVLEIEYRYAPIGSLTRVRIYDAQGRPVRTLRDIELLGTQGSLTWDGANDEGRKAKAGAYLILIELISADGPVETEKLVAVLAGEL